MQAVGPESSRDSALRLDSGKAPPPRLRRAHGGAVSFGGEGVAGGGRRRDELHEEARPDENNATNGRPGMTLG